LCGNFEPLPIRNSPARLSADQELVSAP